MMYQASIWNSVFEASDKDKLAEQIAEYYYVSHPTRFLAPLADSIVLLGDPDIAQDVQAFNRKLDQAWIRVCMAEPKQYVNGGM